MQAQKVCVDCNADSLTTLLINEQLPSERLYTLVSLTDMSILPQDPDSALNCIQQVLALNKFLNLIDPKPYYLMRKGLTSWKKHKGDSTLYYFRKAISAYDEQRKVLGNNSLLNSIREFYNFMSAHEERRKFYEDKLRYYLANGPVENTAACYHGLAGYYYFKSDYNRAIGYYLKSSEVFKRFSFTGYSNEITEVGLMYSRWGSCDRALYYLKLADSLNRSKQASVGDLEDDKMEIARIYQRKKQYSEAIEYCKQALKTSFLLHHPDRAAFGYAELAGIYLQMEKPDTALKFLKLAKHLGDSNHIFIDGAKGQFELEFYFYQYYLHENDLKNAEKWLTEAYRKAIEIKSDQLVLKYSKELTGFYSKSKRIPKALEFYQKYSDLYDSINALQNSENIAQYENEQKEQQSLRQISKIKEVAFSQRRNYMIAGSILLAMLVLIFSRMQYIRKTKKQLEEKNRIIEKEKLRAEQSEKFKEEFLATMSHEIRTPMNAVMGMTNLLIEKNPPEEQYKYLYGIKKSSENLLHILNNILDLSKIEAGKIELEKIDFSLENVISQVIQILTQKAGEKGIQILSRVDDDVHDLLIGDPIRLNQILMNLAGNAIKYTEKGYVEIAVKPVINPNVAIQKSSDFPPAEESTPPAPCFLYQFLVTDTGIGIAEDKIEHIFESFSQASSSDTRRYGGTGLGLTIAKHLVELMGGNIKVESKTGSGTTFSFILQMEQGSAERLHQRILMEEEIDGTVLNGIKILIVDDNEYNRIVATDTLKSKADLDITTAINGQEAVELLKQADFDLVLMDVQMPVMDGYEATRYIRGNFPSPKKDIPVIALTASVLRSDLDKCRQAGMNGSVTKPFKAYQLIRGIAEVMGIEIMTVTGREKLQEPTFIIAKANVTDLNYLKQFCDGDVVRMRKYISMFLTTAPALVAKITAALARNDFEEIANQI